VFLGRPFSVFGREDGLVRFLIAARGRGTADLADLRAGEAAELTGPLGNGWGEVVGRDGGPLALIGGGVGIAPLAAFAAELGPGAYDFYAGFKSAPFGLEGVSPRSMIIASETGTGGQRGRIPGFLDPVKYRAVYACGPEAMLKTVAASCKAAGVPCIVSLERAMACGTGACLGCTVKTAGGNRRCCADGPVFRAEELIFDE
jgi:NAD(P)H-flavin reductase